jgi:hypothetical protein
MNNCLLFFTLVSFFYGIHIGNLLQYYIFQYSYADQRKFLVFKTDYIKPILDDCNITLIN